jgi:O-methyltransferase
MSPVNTLRDACPRALLMAYRFARQSEGASLARIIRNQNIRLSVRERVLLLARWYRVTLALECAHGENELLPVLTAILSTPQSTPGVVIEAGCFKGGSTAKLSLAAAAAGRQLFAFDSFQGIPDNDEVNQGNLDGGANVIFKSGDYCGTLDAVKRNIGTAGRLDVCSFMQGWFEETMPHFNKPVIAGYIDVDLASSTRTCLKYLYPLLVPGGSLFSQDGHLPLVVDVLKDEEFWREEVGFAKPPMAGLGTHKIVRISKPAADQ